MMMDGNERVLAPLERTLLDPVIAAFHAVDWSGPEFSRPEGVLKDGRLVEYPMPIAQRSRVRTPAQDALVAATQPILDHIIAMPRFVHHMWVRGEIAGIPPGATLGWHIDTLWFHANCIRLHVPLLTNDGAYLLWEGVRSHLTVGRLYEINNRVLHSATNEGSALRVHLILDIMPIAQWDAAVAAGTKMTDRLLPPGAPPPPSA